MIKIHISPPATYHRSLDPVVEELQRWGKKTTDDLNKMIESVEDNTETQKSEATPAVWYRTVSQWS